MASAAADKPMLEVDINNIILPTSTSLQKKENNEVITNLIATIYCMHQLPAGAMLGFLGA